MTRPRYFGDRPTSGELFKAPRKETIWSNNATEGETSSSVAEGNTHEQSLCDPTHSPRSGCGPWTKEQQRLSEVRELPPVSLASDKRNRVSKLTVLIQLTLIASLGTLVWRAIPGRRI